MSKSRRDKGRRWNNEGTVFEYPKGSGIWYAQLSADEVTGKRPKRRAKSEQEAKKLLREMERDRDQGIDLIAKKPTITELMEIWLDKRVKPTLKASTLASYETVLRLYILPYIGSVRINRLNIDHVQNLINTLISEGYSPHTIKNAYIRLRGMIKYALGRGWTKYSFNADLQLPSTDDINQVSLKWEEVKYFLKLVENHRLAPLFHFYPEMGLRRGEGLGLLWSDLDWNAATIAIRQQVQPIYGKTTISSPKTKSSIRILPVPTHLMEQLRTHWEKQQEEKRLKGDYWNQHGLIFPSTNGTPISPRNLNRLFATFAKRAGLENIHIHTCRYFCATELGELGTEERVIGVILGHTTKNITASYAKVTLPMMRAALDKLADKLNNEEA